MAVTNIKYALSFLSDISCDLSHQCLLCLYWIGTRGFEFSLQDPITLRTKEPPPFSKNSLNPAKTVWDIMIFWENFSWDLAGCFLRKQYHSIVSWLFYLWFPLSEESEEQEGVATLQQSVFHFLSNCLHRCHPYNMVPRAHTRAKNVRARTGKRPKLIIHHLHISLPRPWPRSFYPQISCKPSHLQHLKIAGRK